MGPRRGGRLGAGVGLVIDLDYEPDLARTLAPVAHGWGDPTIRIVRGAAEVWRASRTPDGPGTIRLVAVGPARISVEAWGPGAGWLRAQAPGLVGATDDVAGFDPSSHPLVNRLARTHAGFRIPRTERVFEALVPTILGQKITAVAALRAWKGLVRMVGEPAPGPAPASLLLPPDPERIAALPYHAFHPLGVERRRAEVIRSVARHAARLEEAVGLGGDVLRRRLSAIPGVGPWTIAKVCLVALGDADAVEVGDFHIPHQVSWALAGEPRGDDARMLQLLAPWPGHRGRVVRLIATGASHAPRYGPRLAPRSIAWH